nr:ribonuclease H-like domain-containing protein [Tanacetum cinerariifolium]
MEAQPEITQNISSLKLPMLKTGDYDLWSMRMEQYLTHTDYALWEVNINGDSPIPEPPAVGTVVPPKTEAQKLARKNKLKAKSTLLLAIPDEHQLKFHSIKDAKSLWETIKIRFGGNKESKKINKTILKQQYENFVASRSEGLEKTYDRYKRLRLKGNQAQASTLIMLLLCLLETPAAGSKEQPSASSYADDIDTDDLEEMNLKWQVAMITMRVKKFMKKTGRNLNFNGKEQVSFDKTRVECYNCHIKGHFARECHASENQGNRSGDNERRVVPVETPASALVVKDRLDHKNQLEEAIKEKDDLKEKLTKFEESSKNLTKRINSQMSANDKTGLGYDSQLSANEMPKCEILKAASDSSVSETDEDNNKAKDRNFVPTAVATKSGQVLVNAAKQSSTASTCTSRPKVNTVAIRPNMNAKSSYFKPHFPKRRHFNQRSATKTNTFSRKINTAKGKNVTNIGPKAVVNTAEGKKKNTVKSSACWIWRPTRKLIYHTSKDSGSYTLKRFNYVYSNDSLKEIHNIINNVLDSKLYFACVGFQTTPQMIINSPCLTDKKELASPGQTATVKKVNNQEQIQALVDKNKVIIMEDSTRSDLRFDDAEGTLCLLNEAIFEGLARMRRKQRKEAKVSNDEPKDEDHVSTPSNDPLPSGEDSFILNELMVFYTSLQEHVLDLQEAKVVQVKGNCCFKKESHQAKQIENVKIWRAQEIEKGRMIEEIDQNAEIALDDETHGMTNDDKMFGVDDLPREEVVMDTKTSEHEEQIIEDVSTAELVTTAGEVVTTTVKDSAAPTTDVTEDEITMAQALAALKSIKPKVVDKGKANMIEPEVPIKKKDQMRIDEEYAKKLEAEEQEATRLSRAQQDEEANNS